MIPAFDFETRSAAGYVWNEEDQCWEGPPGAAECGLELVGVKNYVNHPTFKVLCLAYNLFDGLGVRLWTPGQESPRDLLRHVALRGMLSAWNVAFELEVWNSNCVRMFGWPPLILDQLICDMATARAWTLPGKLANAGDVLNLDIKKDSDGSRLIDKFTIPRQPTKKNDAMWNEPDDPDPPPPRPKKSKVQPQPDLFPGPYNVGSYMGYVGNGSADDDIPF